MKNPANYLPNIIERIPGLSDVYGVSDERQELQKRLEPFTNRLIILGEFATNKKYGDYKADAREFTSTLRESSINRGGGAVMVIMSPDTYGPSAPQENTREALSEAFHEDYEGPVSWLGEPVVIPATKWESSGDRLQRTTYSELLDKLELMDETRLSKSKSFEADKKNTFFVISSPQFALRALAIHRHPADMSDGRFLALHEVGRNIHRNIWKSYFLLRHPTNLLARAYEKQAKSDVKDNSNGSDGYKKTLET